MFTKRERNIAQQKKLLQQYPELFNLKNTWELGRDRLITVRNVKMKRENRALFASITIPNACAEPSHKLRNCWIVREAPSVIHIGKFNLYETKPPEVFSVEFIPELVLTLMFYKAPRGMRVKYLIVETNDDCYVICHLKY